MSRGGKVRSWPPARAPQQEVEDQDEEGGGYLAIAPDDGLFIDGVHEALNPSQSIVSDVPARSAKKSAMALAMEGASEVVPAELNATTASEFRGKASPSKSTGGVATTGSTPKRWSWTVGSPKRSMAPAEEAAPGTELDLLAAGGGSQAAFQSNRVSWSAKQQSKSAVISNGALTGPHPNGRDSPDSAGHPSSPAPGTLPDDQTDFALTLARLKKKRRPTLRREDMSGAMSAAAPST